MTFVQGGLCCADKAIAVRLEGSNMSESLKPDKLGYVILPVTCEGCHGRQRHRVDDN